MDFCCTQILTADEMRAADRATTERFGVPSLELMEHAGQAVARFVLRHFALVHRITVLCGRGNNGGDGFVAARALYAAGREVTVVLLDGPADLKGDAHAMFSRLDGVPVVVATEADFPADALAALRNQTDLFLDAVTGTGFRPPLRGAAVAAGQWLAASSAPVVAVDLPSGWDADSRVVRAEGAFRADAVVTFTAPKPAHVFGSLTRGSIVVTRIGSPAEAVVSASRLRWAGAAKKRIDQPRPPESNKGRFGHVLVVGGSKGKSGAPAMAAMAALRAGAGLVTAAVPESILPTVAGFAPELMTTALMEGSRGEVSTRNLEACNLEPLLEKKTVLAVGPGLGQRPGTVSFVHGLLRESELPIVLDADALNALAGHLGLLDGRSRTIVLTPHPGEMARLAGLSVAEVESHREDLAREFALRHHITLVLKGWRTLIAHPDGMVAVNTSGNPGMAKGGSGDVLTGILAAMLAQYPQAPEQAVEAAVYLHGLAADLALGEQNEHTLLATDALGKLYRAFRFQPEDKDGYVWLQGNPTNITGL